MAKASRAKQKKVQDAWSKSQIKTFTSSFLEETTEEFAREWGDETCCTLGQSSRLVIGLPFPSFCLEYVFQNTVFPLERLTQIVGVEGTLKSSLTFEIARWFRAHSGIAFLFEHESKYSADMACSILGWDDENAMAHIPCDSINDWQKRLQKTMQRVKDKMLVEGGSGKTWPALFLVDSVMAKATEDTQKKITDTGFAGRAFADEARMITAFMRKVPQDLRKWPFCMVAVNHLKPGTNPMTGAIERNKAGGRGLSFQETFEIELKRHAQYKIEKAEVTGRRLNLEVYKNSLGRDRLFITVEVLWWDEKMLNAATGEYEWKQRTVWDWHTSSIRLLQRQEGAMKRKVQEIVNFVSCRNNTRVHASSLGISEKEPVSFSEAGAILMQRPDVLNALRPLFGIKQRVEFVPGQNFDQLVKEHKHRVATYLREEEATNGRPEAGADTEDSA